MPVTWAQNVRRDTISGVRQVLVNSVAEWAEACSSAFVPLKVRAGVPRFAATLEHVELPASVSISRVASEGSEVYRSDRVIAEHPRDDLLLSFHLSGRGSVLQHDREACLRPGNAALYDASVPYTLSFPGRMSEIVLQVPRRTVNRSGHALTDITARVLPPSASMTALSNLMCSLASMDYIERERTESELLAEALTTLLRAALIPVSRPGPTPVSSYALGFAIRTYIDGHFADPELSVESLAGMHHVSVRLVHRIFADQGESPAAYIRRKRITNSHTLLREGLPVTSAAMRSGFKDLDTFTRAFKRHYGYLPSTLRP
ncbi:AraC-like ligand-binding domain-containing protein [Arthrobacter sp. MMS24-S77]